MTTSDSGNTTHKFHDQPQGIVGTGLVTGDTYHATGETQETVSLKGAAPYEFTYVNNFRIIESGPGNNFLVHETQHMTVNANGGITAQVDNVSVDCK